MRNKIWIIVLAVLVVLAAALYLILNPVEGNMAAGEDAGLSHGVLINEIMASNSGYVPDDDGDFSDWIELYNPTDSAVDLSAWALSDNGDEAKWPIPQGTVLQPGDYLVIYCSGKNRSDPDAPLHASFKLKAGTESAVLVDGGGRMVQQVPAIAVGEGMTLARTAAGEYEEMLPSPGYENSEAGIQAYRDSLVNDSSPLVISEFQPNNQSTYPGEDGSYPDWIEIHNPSTEAIDISGYGLSDDGDRPLKWSFPKGSRIEAGQYLLVLVDGAGDLTAANSDMFHASFNLDSYAESVALSDERGAAIDYIDYEDVPADASYGRDTSGQWRVFVQPTPGYPNTVEGYQQYSAAIQQTAYLGGVYVSEVMLANRSYAALEGEHYDWIELHNPTEQSVNLSGWGLSDDSGYPRKWRFPDGQTIGPGEYLLVYASGLDLPKKKFETDPTGMMMASDAAAGAVEDGMESEVSLEDMPLDIPTELGGDEEEGPLAGTLHTSFSLSNLDGEIVTLWDGEGQLVDRLACPPQLYETSAGRVSPDGPYRLFTEPSPGSANEGADYSGRLEAPTIQLPAGLYQGDQTVTVEYGSDGQQGYQLRYTTDGSRPTESSPEWPGSIGISQTSALRVSAFDPNGQLLPSQPATATYIIDSPHGPELSIVSVSINPDDMYSDDHGIYAMGPNAGAEDPYHGANFWQDWERAAQVEVFASPAEGGQLEISQEVAIRIFGAYSRGRDQKGFALVPRTIYGSKSFDYPVFDNRPYESYRSLVLRAGAQDSTVTKIHDVVATSLVDGTTNLEVQAYRQAVLYINGEYFGYYHIREKINKDWVAQHYGYDRDNIDLLVANGTPLAGDDEAYKELIDYCKGHNLSNEEDYQYVADRVDIDNYIDYLIGEMYVANTDTGNIKFFRERSNDPEKSKWRWIYYDFCWSFISVEMDSYDFLTNPQGHGVGKMLSTQLTRSLMQNQNFRNQFLRRFAELLNTVYAPENVLAKIEEVEAVLAPEKTRDSERWPQGSVGGWESNMRHMKYFAENRADYCVGFLRKHFELGEADAQRIFGRPGKMSENWTTSGGGSGEVPGSGE